MSTIPRSVFDRPLRGLINTASGGCDSHAVEQMRDIFARAGLTHAEVVGVAPPKIDEALARAAATADVLVVLGGDGTIRAAAATCAHGDKYLVPLPGGTMNMLPRALYGPRSWEDALADTLADPCVHPISGGRAGNEPFFCAALLGAPSLWADAREAVRRGNLIEACNRAITAIRRSTSETLSYRMDNGPTLTAEAVAVICPLISRAMTEDEPSLEAAAIEPMAAAALFRLAVHAIFDDWRNDPSVSLARIAHMDVRGRGRLPVILDGEKVRIGRIATVDFVPFAFRALAPAGPMMGAVTRQ